MKTLVYYTLGYSDKYLTCLEISIQSLRKYHNDCDILVLIDMSLIQKAKENIHNVEFIICPDSKSPEEASMRKLAIFDYNIEEYDTVIFIDTDIIIHMDVLSLAPLITKPDALYVYSEYDDINTHITLKHYFSIKHYSQDEMNYFKKNSIKVFNAGLFGFKTTPAMKTHFNSIREMVKNHTGSFFYEQSFMNTYFNLNGMTDRSVFTTENYKLFPEDNVDYKGKIVHFCGNITDGSLKSRRMKLYISKFI